MVFAENCRTFGIIILGDGFAVLRPRFIDRIFYETINDVRREKKEFLIDLVKRFGTVTFENTCGTKVVAILCVASAKAAATASIVMYVPDT